MSKDKKFDYYRKGTYTFDDLINNPDIKNEKQLRQMEYPLLDKGDYSVIEKLSQLFPDLAVHLLNIRSNIKDLLVPF